MYFTVGRCAAFVTIWMAIFITTETLYGSPASFPEPYPPAIDYEVEVQQAPATELRAVSPSIEWKYHKTADGRHPNDKEQQLVWLMNRARSNPAVEGVWLASIYDRYYPFIDDCSRVADDIGLCYIAGALDVWGVDLNLLQDDFAGYDAKPPAAFDVRLYRAARNHSEYLISIDDQSHAGQFDRIDDQNFFYSRARGNVYSYALKADYGHAAFNVDWGPDGGNGSGMQSPPGHRLAIMSIDGKYTNVGYAVLSQPDLSLQVGPLVITGNYCQADTLNANHYNRFLVGTVWSDKDGDDYYDPGEGIGGVTVKPDQGLYFAVTSNSGGYAVPITGSGIYEVTFSGSALSEDVVRSVRVVSESVLLDLVTDVSPGASADAADSGSGGGSGGSGGGGRIPPPPAPVCVGSA